MNFKNFTWDKDFEIKGYFSETPQDIYISNNSLSGILRYSPREIILELFGEFPEEKYISFGFGKHLEKIYGFSSNGKILILSTYAQPTGESSTPGFPITKHHIKNFKMYDVRYNEIENFNYNSESISDLINMLESNKVVEYKFSFDHIEDWIDKSLVAFKSREKNEILESAVNEYQPTKVVIDTMGMSLEDTAILNISYTTTSFKSDYFIKLKSVNSKERSLDEFYKTSIKFKEFIEILSNIPLSFTDNEFLVDFKMIGDKRFPLIKGKYFVQHARKYKEWKKFSKQDISLRNIDSNFNNILNHWFNKSEELEFIVKEFSKNLHGDLYLEDQLVDAIRNLEVYSRNFRNFNIQQHLSDDEEQAKNLIMQFINTNIQEGVRKKFRNKLKYNKKEPNLSERLKDLFDSIDEDNKTKVFSSYFDTELLITRLIQTRNYHTHGDSKKKYPKMISDFNEMYKTKIFLQEVLRYYIYEQLDMEYGNKTL